MSIDVQGRANSEGSTIENQSRGLDALIRRRTPALVRFLTRQTRNPEDALDLAQEAFLRLTRATRAKKIDNPEGYLTLIARNLLRDRAKNVSDGYERRHALLEPDLHAANEGDPHDALEARQTLELYEAAVMGLKPKTREIFLLHRLDGKSYGEISVIMRIGQSGVKKHMITAIAHIDRVLSRP